MLGPWDNRLIDQASDVSSIIFFSNVLQNSFNLIFYNFTKIKMNNFECSMPVTQSIKIILGPSYAWSMRQSSDPAYYIEGCQISIRMQGC